MVDTPTQDAAPGLISVVIPLFDEGRHLAVVVDRVLAALATTECDHELVLVDDGSRDASWRTIEDLAQGSATIVGIRLSRSFGKEAAIAAGLNHARGDAVVVMDGDLQHPPELLGEMISRWRAGGVDLVEATKSDRGREAWWARIGGGLFPRLFQACCGVDLAGATDYKLLDRRVVEAWQQLGERTVFFRGMTEWLGFRREQIPFAVAERVGGGSRWSLRQRIQLAVSSVTSYSSIPLQVTTAAGVLFFAFSVLLGGHTLYMKFSGQAVSGFTTVILVLLITGSCVMTSIGVVGLYIARIYEEVKRRPRYLVAGRTPHR
jgi:glycosyltransferase involved in cell wall biosynthesis